MELFTCRVCRREYDIALEKCPQCKAWQGDNKVMADGSRGVPEPPSGSSEAPVSGGGLASDLLLEFGLGGMLLITGLVLLALGHTTAGYVVIGLVVLPVALFVFDM